MLFIISFTFDFILFLSRKSNDLPTQVPFISATDSPCLNPTNDREVIKVVTTAGPQCVDKEFLNHLLTRKDVIPARKRRDFIPNDMKDDHYWERRRKNNLAAKRSREKRRLNDIVLGNNSSLIKQKEIFSFIRNQSC
jgi:hypothetical protein